MQIQIVAVGRIKEKYLQEGIEEYCKRLHSWAKLRITEVKEESPAKALSDTEKTLISQKESERLIHAVKSGYTIALDKSGPNISSEKFAYLLNELMITGKVPINFLIGGSLGISQEILDRADLKISFGLMTFPHQLFRLMLMEQLYRAYTIIENIPYHK
jgi:23S rRNA (pseudouridine1915-N3)-methyltransferase